MAIIPCTLKEGSGACSTPLDVRDVSVGQDQQQFMHTISAGDQASPPMVMLPGYGAGSGFYFRNIGGLAQHFRLHCVDLLGTGMSGKRQLPFPGSILNCCMSLVLVSQSWNGWIFDASTVSYYCHEAGP